LRFPRTLGQNLRSSNMTSTMITMITIVPTPMNISLVLPGLACGHARLPGGSRPKQAPGSR
jgi:hypothetical protein